MDDYVKKTIAVYDRIAASYEEKTKDLGPIPERTRFMGMVKPHGTILDAGCGTGRDSAVFFENGFVVTGADLSGELLKIAKKKAPHVTFLQADLRDMPCQSNSFDGIWACASLLHLHYEEAEKVLKDFYSFLRTDGTLFVFVKVGSGEHESFEPSTPGIPRMFAFYDTERLTKAIKNAGFSVVDTYSYDEGTRFPHLKGKWWLVCFAKK
jgi:ubiquinone/menaquinone biosynthesis C-methylase UbiE